MRGSSAALIHLETADIRRRFREYRRTDGAECESCNAVASDGGSSSALGAGWLSNPAHPTAPPIETTGKLASLAVGLRELMQPGLARTHSPVNLDSSICPEAGPPQAAPLPAPTAGASSFGALDGGCACSNASR